MKKKNEKGFTLIELLAVMTIMLIILGVAIVNFIKISDKKKQEAWEDVKAQIETAAKEYFTANEYLFEGLSDGSTGTISVGKLVEEDYLNKVTNPLTGKSLNNCDYVEVTLGTSGNDYVYKYTQNNTNSECNANSYVIVSEVGAPKISVDITKGTKNNDYYVTDVDITAIVETGGNGAIKSVKHCTSSKECTASNSLAVKSGKKNNYTVTNYSLMNNTSGVDGNKVTTYFVATNTSDKKVIGSVTYKKDTEKPICGTNNGSTTWVKDKRTITQKCTDKTSGCAKDNYIVSFTNTTRIGKIKIEDKAGNVNDCDANVYVDADSPTCGNTTGEGSASSWTNKERKITQNCSDEGSGCDSVTKSFSEDATTGIITVKDKVGHETKCSVGVYIDTKKPTCKLSLSGTKGNKVSNLQWYTSNVTVNLSINDTGESGESGVSTYGLNTTQTSTNKKTSATQSSETSKVTWYGYVVDAAGNTNSCNTSFGIEKSVKLNFDIATTNNAIATSSGAKNGKVFNTSYSGVKKYSDSDSGNCLREKGNNYAGCAEDTGDNKFYFGKSCMNIGDFIRTFSVNATSASQTNGLVYGGNEETSSGLIHVESGTNKSYSRKQNPTTVFNNTYKTTDLNNSGSRINFTKHVFQYQSPAGNLSNLIILYTEYSVDCKY